MEPECRMTCPSLQTSAGFLRWERPLLNWEVTNFSFDQGTGILPGTMELSKQCRAFTRRPTNWPPLSHVCFPVQCVHMKPSMIIYAYPHCNSTGTWFGLAEDVLSQRFAKLSEAVPIPNLSQDSRNVVWWRTEHPHPAWQRFRLIRRLENDTVHET